MPKSVAFLPRYAAVSAAANHRYREALAVVDDPARPAGPSTGSGSRCGFPGALVACLQPRGHDRPRPFAAVLRGEHTLHGFRHRDVRTQLFVAADPPRSAQVTRLVERLHLRGLVATFPRSRRGRVTQLGHATMSAAVLLREEEFPAVFLKTAA